MSWVLVLTRMRTVVGEWSYRTLLFVDFCAVSALKALLITCDVLDIRVIRDYYIIYYKLREEYSLYYSTVCMHVRQYDLIKLDDTDQHGIQRANNNSPAFFL